MGDVGRHAGLEGAHETRVRLHQKRNDGRNKQRGSRGCRVAPLESTRQRLASIVSGECLGGVAPDCGSPKPKASDTTRTVQLHRKRSPASHKFI